MKLQKQTKQEQVDQEEQKQRQDIYKTISYERYNGGESKFLKVGRNVVTT